MTCTKKGVVVWRCHSLCRTSHVTHMTCTTKGAASHNVTFALPIPCLCYSFFLGASWCNLNDDVTTYPMMTSLCVIDLIMLGLVYGLGDVINMMTSLCVISL